jgi:maleamate amidohydrolase
VRGDYLRRGFTSRIGWGARPAVLVVDLTSGFTDPITPLGADLTDVIAATNRILEIARPAATPVIFTSIAYGDPVVEGGHWVRKISALELLKEGSPLVEVDPRLGRRSNEPVNADARRQPPLPSAACGPARSRFPGIGAASTARAGDGSDRSMTRRL